MTPGDAKRNTRMAELSSVGWNLPYQTRISFLSLSVENQSLGSKLNAGDVGLHSYPVGTPVGTPLG